MKLLSTLLKAAFLTCVMSLDSATANPALDDVLQYDVLFTAEYKITDSKGEFVVQKKLKGVISEKIMDRVESLSKLQFKKGQYVIFRFWKNGSNEFGMTAISWNKYYIDKINGVNWKVTIHDLEKALKENP